MNLFPIKPIFIEEILLFKRIKVKANHFTKTSSTPCHLVHYIIKGSYNLMIQRRQYSVKAGQTIYYEDSEEVIWLDNPEPVEFYSIAFKSQYFQAPNILKRVSKATKKAVTLFQKIEELTKPELAPQDIQHKEFHIYNNASLLVFELFKNQDQVYAPEENNRWVTAEEYLKRNHLYSINLEELASNLKTSTATLRRDCHKKFNTSPIKRLQARRMDAAKGLLAYTPIQIKQIADQLGYERMHEFSREFSTYFKKSPTEYRAQLKPK